MCRKIRYFGLTKMKMKIAVVFVLVLVTIVLADKQAKGDSQNKRHGHEKSNHRNHQKHSGDVRHRGRSHNGHNRRGHGSGHQGRLSHHENRASDANQTTTVILPISVNYTETTTQNETSTVGGTQNETSTVGGTQNETSTAVATQNETSTKPTPPARPIGPVPYPLPYPIPLPDPLRIWIQTIMKELGDDYRCLNQLAFNLTVAIRGNIREPLFNERQVTLAINDTIIFNVRVHFGISCSNADQENAPTLLGQIQQSFNNLWENLTCAGQIIGNVIREVVTVFLRSGSLGPTNIIFKINNVTVYNATLSFNSESCTTPIAQPRSSSEQRLAGHFKGRHLRRH